MQLLLLVLLLGLSSCGAVKHTTDDSELIPLTAVRDPLPIDQSYATSLHRIERNAIAVIGRDERLQHLVTRIDTALTRSWQTTLPGTTYDEVDLDGVHSHDGALYVPMFHGTGGGAAEYKAHTFDLVTGAAREPLSLTRLSPSDTGALHHGFGDQLRAAGLPRVRSIWTHDSSKILLYKSYPVGNDRMTIEMTLYKRGFSMITRKNVDFRFDRRKQELLGVLSDNDGVAYIFLRNLLDSSFEVGRFEILGSMRLRTIKHKIQSGEILPDQGQIAIAPRGHAYIAGVGATTESNRAIFIDFDFYKNSATVVPIDIRSRSGRSRVSVHDIIMAPEADRTMVMLVEGEQASEKWLHFSALDLYATHVWSTEPLSQQSEGEAKAAVLPGLRSDAVSLLYSSGDTLYHRTFALEAGRWNAASAIAIVTGSTSIGHLGRGQAILIGTHAYLINRKKLYQLIAR